MTKIKFTVADIPHMLKMWDQKLNKELPENVAASCKVPKHWRCPDCGYSWSVPPKTRYKSSGKCPCHESNKVICRGINDILTLVNGLDDFLDEENDFEKIYKQGLDSSLHVNYKCDVCGRKWSSSLRTQVKKDGNGGYIATGCPHYNTVKRKKSDVPFCSEVETISRFWDSKNPMDPASTKSNSTDSAHFICKNCGYDWTTDIRAQARGTGKCKCCELQLVIRKGVTDVFTLIPESKKFYDFNKNKNIDIYSIPLRDQNIMISWKCPDCGNEWDSPLSSRVRGKKDNYSFSGCKNCYINILKNKFTPVSSVPKLLKYWDFKKNKARNLDPNLTSAYLEEDADWHCKKCGYEWTSQIKGRMNSNITCPFCEGTHKPVIKNKNDVLTLCPELAEIYDFDYNAKQGINIYEEGESSKIRAHFKCPKCGNGWDSAIGKRIKKNDDGSYRLVPCSKCSNGSFRKIPYSVEFPLLAKMYREDLNHIPLDFIRGKKAIFDTYYYWDCLECGETFDSTLNSMRASFQCSTHGCPYCSKSRLRKGESFAELHPEHMDEYDPQNIIDPYNTFPNCKDSSKWICRDCGYHWNASFHLRHEGQGKCPICNRTLLIPDKNSFAAVYPDYSKYWADSNKRKADEVFYNSSEWFRFICPVCNLEHGAYISDFITGNSCPFCKEHFVSPEKTSLKALYPDLVKRWSSNNSFGPETVFPTSWVWVKWICDICSGEYNARIKDKVNGKDKCPYCNETKVLSGFNSFGDKHPDLITEMDNIANYLLPKSPYDVFDTSNYKFWFNCKNNPKHKYLMSPSARLMFQKRNREPCLYCRGQRRKLNHFILSDKKP